ncbi:Contig11497.g12307 [Symbiodinium natans]|uniref:Contig11497.g12307 protein n=1 Tax=Symbiodinium natans TaxID=878477 RepID=A0A812LJA9_9DINO|nr:Contig11497.g12307 [Symbiodinium natans]
MSDGSWFAELQLLGNELLRGDDGPGHSGQSEPEEEEETAAERAARFKLMQERFVKENLEKLQPHLKAREYLASIEQEEAAFDRQHQLAMQEAQMERAAKEAREAAEREAAEAAERAATRSPASPVLLPDDVSDDEFKAREQEPHDIFESLPRESRDVGMSQTIAMAAFEIFRLVMVVRSCTTKTVVEDWKEVFQDAANNWEHRQMLIYVLHELSKQKPGLADIQSLLRQLFAWLLEPGLRLTAAEREWIAGWVFTPDPSRPHLLSCIIRLVSSPEWTYFFERWREQMLQESPETLTLHMLPCSALPAGNATADRGHRGGWKWSSTPGAGLPGSAFPAGNATADRTCRGYRPVRQRAWKWSSAPGAGDAFHVVVSAFAGAISSQLREKAPANAAAATELRRRLNTKALTEEEALQLASASDGKAAAGNAAQRAKISKLAADLAKVLGTSSVAAAASSEDQFHCLGYLNLEKAESVLNEFAKVLTQVQREADVALILKLNCARMVVDLCCRVKDNIASFEMAGDKAPVVAWKQNCNVQLCALKWLGLLCKSRLARLVLLLTGRVTLLADVATAYLDMHFAEALKPQDVEGGPVLFLPQLLHVLALHMKQAPPEGARDLQGSLAAYLILCGLAEKLRELFGRAEIRGLKLFDGASPLPLLLLRAMCFLHILVNAYRRPGGAQPEASSSPDVIAAIAASNERVLETLRNTELFGVVGILVSILLSDGRREKGAKLPQTVVSLCVQALRILNCVAQIDLKTLQKTMGAGAGRQQELYHVLVTLLDYCVARIPGNLA